MMLSLPGCRTLVVQVAGETVPPVLTATEVHPEIAVDPFRNSTVPAG